MEPPRSPPLVLDSDQQGIHSQGGDDPASNNDDTISVWDFLQEYCHIDVNNITSRAAASTTMPMETDVIEVDDDDPQTRHEDDDVVLPLCRLSQRDCTKTQGMASPTNGKLNLDLQLHYGEIHAKAPSHSIQVAPSGSRELKGGTTSASPCLGTSSTMIEESTGLVATQPMGMTFYSENVPSAGYNMPLPPPLAGSKSKMLVAAAAAADPLQLSIGTHAPAANHHMPRSSSVTFSRYMGSGININLLPPEKKTVVIPNDASLSLETKEPYERPLLGLIGKKDPAPFAPVILESSEVAEAAADHPLHEFSHGAATCKNIAPIKAKQKRRRYIWPANKVAKLDGKIEQLRKEALLSPVHRRSMLLIQKDIDELQGKKDEIHARIQDMMWEDDEGDSTQ